MKSIRCGRGLGDSIYLQSVVRHLLGPKLPSVPTLRVMSDYPDVFRPLGQAVQVAPFSRLGVGIVAHYVQRKAHPATTQFVDCCLAAHIAEPPPLHLPWTLTDASLAHDLHALAAGRPIVILQLPRAPMGRTDGFGAELLPDCRAIQTAIDALRQRDACIVQVGAGQPLYRFAGLHADYANRTSVAQLIDIASLSSAAIGYPSFLVPLAESLDLPALFVWSRRGLRSPRGFIAQITPGKLLHKRATSRAIVDDAVPDLIARAAAALLERPPRPSFHDIASAMLAARTSQPTPATQPATATP